MDIPVYKPVSRCGGRAAEEYIMMESTTAPDFALIDIQGKTIRLSDYRGHKHVILVFNRGFM
jgi:hypothetical protein